MAATTPAPPTTSTAAPMTKTLNTAASSALTSLSTAAAWMTETQYARDSNSTTSIISSNASTTTSSPPMTRSTAAANITRIGMNSTSAAFITNSASPGLDPIAESELRQMKQTYFSTTIALAAVAAILLAALIVVLLYFRKKLKVINEEAKSTPDRQSNPYVDNPNSTRWHSTGIITDQSPDTVVDAIGMGQINPGFHTEDEYMEPEVVRTPQKAEGANPKPKKSVTLPVGTAPQTRRPRAASDTRHKTSKTSDRGIKHSESGDGKKLSKSQTLSPTKSTLPPLPQTPEPSRVADSTYYVIKDETNGQNSSDEENLYRPPSPKRTSLNVRRSELSKHSSTGTHHSVGSGSNHTGESSDDDIYENYTGATAAAAASDPTQESETQSPYMDMSISRTTSMNDDGADDGADEGESDYMNNEEVRGLTNRSEDRSPHNSVQQQEEETYEEPNPVGSRVDEDLYEAPAN